MQTINRKKTDTYKSAWMHYSSTPVVDKNGSWNVRKSSESSNEWLAIYSGGILEVKDLSSFRADAKERIASFVSIMKDIVSFFKKSQDYNGYYISYILDQISYEDFLSEAEKLAIVRRSPVDSLTEKKIMFCAKYLADVLGPDELCDIFSVELDDVHRISSALTLVGFSHDDSP